MTELGVGACVHCGQFAAVGVVLGTVERGSGPAVDVVVHRGCERPHRNAIRARLGMEPLPPLEGPQTAAESG